MFNKYIQICGTLLATKKNKTKQNKKKKKEQTWINTTLLNLVQIMFFYTCVLDTLSKGLAFIYFFIIKTEFWAL